MVFCGQLFCSRSILMRAFFSGHRTPVLKRLNWPLFGISGLNSALMRSGDFARFSKNGRISKPEVLWGFRGLNSQFGVVASECRDNDQEKSFIPTSQTTSISAFGLSNIAIYDLVRSRRKSLNNSGPVPRFSKIMTSKIRGSGK
jgi:hypothetical protein